MNYDALIIGSGQAGTPLAFKLAAAEWKIAFIEKQHIGGTCLNVGCTPTKTYVASARRMWDAQNGGDLGAIIPDGTRVDLSKVKQRKDAMINKSVTGITQGIQDNPNIDLYRGSAHFVDNKKIKVNGKELSADKVFINVGGRARVPEGFETVNYLTNETILQLEEVPRHLIIVGGSYIGLEFGQMFRRFGSEVTVIERGDRLLKREDEIVSHAIRDILEDEGIHIRTNADCLNGKDLENGNIEVSLDCDHGPNVVEGSHLLLAAGRQINTDTLDLKNTSIEHDERGVIKVNDKLETNLEGIYALGDCNGMGAFTHTAYNDFEIVTANLLDKGNRKVSDRILNYGLYIDPPLGRAGLTMREAQERGYDILYGYRPMSKVARAKEKGETKGFILIIVDKNTEKILGASILGVGGDEIIGSVLNIMYTGASYKVFRDSVQPHPTVTELIPTVLEGLSEQLKT